MKPSKTQSMPPSTFRGGSLAGGSAPEWKKADARGGRNNKLVVAASQAPTFTSRFTAAWEGGVGMKGLKLKVVRCHARGEQMVSMITHKNLLDELEQTTADESCLLSARDVCKVDPQFASLLPPLIQVSGDTVLISLGSQRLGAIVLTNTLYLLTTATFDPLCQAVQDRLSRAMGAEEVQGPFQLLCLETLLLCASLDIEMRATVFVNKVEEETKQVHDESTLFDDDNEGSATIVGLQALRQKVEDMRDMTKEFDKALSLAIDDDATMDVLQQGIEKGRRSSLPSPASSRKSSYRDVRHRDAAALLMEYYVGKIRKKTAELDKAIYSLNGLPPSHVHRNRFVPESLRQARACPAHRVLPSTTLPNHALVPYFQPA